MTDAARRVVRRRKYLSLGVGELAAAVVFAVVLPRLVGEDDRRALWCALIPLLVVLVQAGSYWLLARGWVARRAMPAPLATVYRGFRWADALPAGRRPGGRAALAARGGPVAGRRRCGLGVRPRRVRQLLRRTPRVPRRSMVTSRAPVARSPAGPGSAGRTADPPASRCRVASRVSSRVSPAPDQPGLSTFASDVGQERAHPGQGSVPVDGQLVGGPRADVVDVAELLDAAGQLGRRAPGRRWSAPSRSDRPPGFPVAGWAAAGRPGGRTIRLCWFWLA